MAATDTQSARAAHEMPFTRLELCVLSVVEGELQVLLAQRAVQPHKGAWALPGGVLRVDLDASLDEAAQRVAQERLGCRLPFLRQLCAVGGPGRDPERSRWALSVVYRALLPHESLNLLPGKRVEALQWRKVSDAIKDRKLAFDHASLIESAVAATRQEIRDLNLPAGFLPEKFTLGELQASCEQLLGEGLDKSSFRRRIADRDLVAPMEGETRTGPNRPAQVYRLKG